MIMPMVNAPRVAEKAKMPQCDIAGVRDVLACRKTRVYIARRLGRRSAIERNRAQDRVPPKEDGDTDWNRFWHS